MDIKSNEVSMESVRLQYELLQSRIALHGNRMWQLPLTYLGTIAVSLSVTSTTNSSVSSEYLFLVMGVLGLVLTWALFGAYEGYSRTASNMNKLEIKLGLDEYTANHVSHSAPYFLLMIFGIACCFIAVTWS